MLALFDAELGQHPGCAHATFAIAGEDVGVEVGRWCRAVEAGGETAAAGLEGEVGEGTHVSRPIGVLRAVAGEFPARECALRDPIAHASTGLASTNKNY